MVYLLRIVFSGILLYIAVICVLSVFGIWKTSYDSQLTVKAAWQPIKRALTSPISMLDLLQTKGTLNVTLAKKDSTVTVIPEGPTSIVGSEYENTANYAISVENTNAFPIFDALITIQVPGAIRERIVLKRLLLQGLDEEPLGGSWDITVSGKSGINIPRTPQPYRTQFRIARTEPGGILETSLLLNCTNNNLIPPYVKSYTEDTVLFFIRIKYKRRVGSDVVEQVQFHRIIGNDVNSLAIGEAEYTAPKYANFVGWEF